MKVKMLVDMSGTLNGEPYPLRGGEMDVPDVVGAKLCAAGLAGAVAVKPAEEKAVPDDDAEKRGPLTTKRAAGKKTETGDHGDA